MRSDVTIIFDARRSVDLQTDVAPSPEAANAARQWFDQAWENLGCEPLRPSGKVLLLDKLMGVADALGYEVLRGTDDRAAEFARQAALALNKPRITIDLPGLVVGY